ncbi:MAG: hypothetical protein KUG76_06425 [Gammaproteobacteria bacterium]|nr:hypothetical protein [Gammaproteobacteria bacterium]
MSFSGVATFMKNSALRLFLLLLIALTSGCMKDQPISMQEVAVQGVYTAALSENGAYALIGSINHGGSLWQTSDMERRYNWNLAAGAYSEISSTALSHNGNIALTADTRQAVFWDTRTGESVGYWSTPADVKTAALSGNGSVAIFGLRDYSAIVVDVSTGDTLFRLGHQGMVGAVSISEDGLIGLTGSDDRSAKLWDLKTGNMLFEWKHSNSVNLVKLSADGKIALTSSQHSGFHLWSIESGQQLHMIKNRSHTVTSVAFSADNQTMLIGTSLQQIDLWKTSSAKRIKTWSIAGKNLWQPSNTKVYAVAFSQQRNHFFSVTSNGVLQEWAL